MCLNPVLLPNGQEVACHKCWQCVRRKIDDWTGRCIAESQTAAGASVVTLTYGRDLAYYGADHMRAAVLTYSDVQVYLRSWRKAGFPLRYFVVGEYGAQKSRSHWHCLLFWQERIPERDLRVRFLDRHWPHGWSFWDQMTPGAVRYACKYIAKEAFSEESQYYKGLSKYPPLGDAYFRQLAAKYVEARLAPQDFFYDFDEARNRKGKKIRFQLQGKSRENFLGYFLHGWWERWGDHPPPSEVVDLYEDGLVKRGSQDEAKRVLAAEKVGAMRLWDTITFRDGTRWRKRPTVTDIRHWMDPSRLAFDEKLNVWKYSFEGGQSPWYWARDREGVYGWRQKIGANGVNVGNAAKSARSSYQGRRDG